MEKMYSGLYMRLLIVEDDTLSAKNLKKGLEEHYQLLIELTPSNHKLTYLDIEVDSLVKNSSAVSS